MIKLRKYQQESVDRAVWDMKNDGNSLIVLPTASGKSLCISGIANELNREILILQPNKEILEQNMKKLSLYVPESEIGVYSASMQRKDISKYTFATIGSIYKKPELFKNISIVAVDEAQDVNPKNLGSMYSSFFRSIGNPKVFGLTATPYRNVPTTINNGRFFTQVTTLKLINRMNPLFWNRILFNINNKDLLSQGYLSPLVYEDRTFLEHQNMVVNKSGTDFDLGSFEKALSKKEEQIIEDLQTVNRKSILVFCTSVEQAVRLAEATNNAEVVHGETPKKDRERILTEFKEGKIRIVYNVGVLTTGFDFPELDCIFLLRPTRSLGLYYQIAGRGVRIAQGKSDCLFVDYTNTVNQLGRIESIELRKEGKWELFTEKGSWHNKQLYSFDLIRTTEDKGKFKLI